MSIKTMNLRDIDSNRPIVKNSLSEFLEGGHLVLLKFFPSKGGSVPPQVVLFGFCVMENLFLLRIFL